METPKPLRIVKLIASNVKILHTVEIEPKTNVVTISGKNASGKSSVLDSIEMCLSGATSIPDRPIREGATKAHVVCDLGDIIVERRFSKSGSTITVTTKEGVALKTPQSVLDSLTQKIGFDPIAFVKLPAQKQFETLRSLVGINFTTIDAKRKLAYDSRTSANRDVESATAKLKDLPQHPDVPEEEVSVSVLMGELNAIREHNKGNVGKREHLQDGQQLLDDHDDAIGQKKRAIEDLEAAVKVCKEELRMLEQSRVPLQNGVTEATAMVAAMVDKSESEVTIKITNADGINARVRANKKRSEVQDELENAETKASRLTDLIDAIDQEKANALAAAKFPLPGLSFDGEIVTLNKIPFAQVNTAQKIQAAVAIGMALNPRIRVILIRDGNDLDDDSMAMLHQMCETNGYQCWVECIKSDAVGAIEIREGEIVSK